MNIHTKVFDHYTNVVNRFGENQVMTVCLYGSQNYGLEYEGSDVDTKAIILPTLEELLKYKQVSTQIQGDNEGGLCDVKHLGIMFNNFLKQNINFMEILYTDYYIINPRYFNDFETLRQMRDRITTMDPVRVMTAAGGMAREKVANFNKPFEGKIETLAKYGYDPKQLASLRRLVYFIHEYGLYQNFDRAIHPNQFAAEEIIAIKRGKYNLNKATELMNDSIELIDYYINEFKKRFDSDEYKLMALHREKELKEEFDTLYLNIMMKKFQGEF